MCLKMTLVIAWHSEETMFRQNSSAITPPNPDPDVHACVNVLVQIPQEFTALTDNPTYLPVIHGGNKTAILATTLKELHNLK